MSQSASSKPQSQQDNLLGRYQSGKHLESNSETKNEKEQEFTKPPKSEAAFVQNISAPDSDVLSSLSLSICLKNSNSASRSMSIFSSAYQASNPNEGKNTHANMYMQSQKDKQDACKFKKQGYLGHANTKAAQANNYDCPLAQATVQGHLHQAFRVNTLQSGVAGTNTAYSQHFTQPSRVANHNDRTVASVNNEYRFRSIHDTPSYSSQGELVDAAIVKRSPHMAHTRQIQHGLTHVDSALPDHRHIEVSSLDQSTSNNRTLCTPTSRNVCSATPDSGYSRNSPWPNLRCSSAGSNRRSPSFKLFKVALPKSVAENTGPAASSKNIEMKFQHQSMPVDLLPVSIREDTAKENDILMKLSKPEVRFSFKHKNEVSKQDEVTIGVKRQGSKSSFQSISSAVLTQTQAQTKLKRTKTSDHSFRNRSVANANSYISFTSELYKSPSRNRSNALAQILNFSSNDSSKIKLALTPPSSDKREKVQVRDDKITTSITANCSVYSLSGELQKTLDLRVFRSTVTYEDKKETFGTHSRLSPRHTLYATKQNVSSINPKNAQNIASKTFLPLSDSDTSTIAADPRLSMNLTEVPGLTLTGLATFCISPKFNDNHALSVSGKASISSTKIASSYIKATELSPITKVPNPILPDGAISAKIETLKDNRQHLSCFSNHIESARFEYKGKSSTDGKHRDITQAAIVKPNPAYQQVFQSSQLHSHMNHVGPSQITVPKSFVSIEMNQSSSVMHSSVLPSTAAAVVKGLDNHAFLDNTKPPPIVMENVSVVTNTVGPATGTSQVKTEVELYENADAIVTTDGNNATHLKIVDFDDDINSDEGPVRRPPQKVKQMDKSTLAAKMSEYGQHKHHMKTLGGYVNGKVSESNTTDKAQINPPMCRLQQLVDESTTQVQQYHCHLQVNSQSQFEERLSLKQNGNLSKLHYPVLPTQINESGMLSTMGNITRLHSTSLELITPELQSSKHVTNHMYTPAHNLNMSPNRTGFATHRIPFVPFSNHSATPSSSSQVAPITQLQITHQTAQANHSYYMHQFPSTMDSLSDKYHIMHTGTFPNASKVGLASPRSVNSDQTTPRFWFGLGAQPLRSPSNVREVIAQQNNPLSLPDIKLSTHHDVGMSNQVTSEIDSARALGDGLILGTSEQLQDQSITQTLESRPQMTYHWDEETNSWIARTQTPRDFPHNRVNYDGDQNVLDSGNAIAFPSPYAQIRDNLDMQAWNETGSQHYQQPQFNSSNASDGYDEKYSQHNAFSGYVHNTKHSLNLSNMNEYDNDEDAFIGNRLSNNRTRHRSASGRFTSRYTNENQAGAEVPSKHRSNRNRSRSPLDPSETYNSVHNGELNLHVKAQNDIGAFDNYAYHIPSTRQGGQPIVGNNAAGINGMDITSKRQGGSTINGTNGRSASMNYAQTSSRSNGVQGGAQSASSEKPRKRINFSPEVVAVLKKWLHDHWNEPYPSQEEKAMLAAQTNLSMEQISHWYINTRMRQWRKRVKESGKYNDLIRKGVKVPSLALLEQKRRSDDDVESTSHGHHSSLSHAGRRENGIRLYGKASSGATGGQGQFDYHYSGNGSEHNEGYKQNSDRGSRIVTESKIPPITPLSSNTPPPGLHCGSKPTSSLIAMQRNKPFEEPSHNEDEESEMNSSRLTSYQQKSTTSRNRRTR